MFVFSWIRAQVREAFKGGVADGLNDVATAMNRPEASLAEVLQQLSSGNAAPAIAPKVDASPEALADKIEPEEEPSVPEPIAERNGKGKRVRS